MNRCEECGQLRPPTSDDYLAQRIDYYRAAHGMLRELNNTVPSTYETLLAARFLAGDDDKGTDEACAEEVGEDG